ncbi:MAG TPA: hypothetical protein VJ836_06420 [Candidatus Saccharimonadales bacterium]|nr:hypothetical protein [Candidatus Saccharimonadales bacterium]
MGRTKGAINKTKVQAVYELTPDERLEIVARLLIELISEELCTEN